MMRARNHSTGCDARPIDTLPQQAAVVLRKDDHHGPDIGRVRVYVPRGMKFKVFVHMKAVVP